MTVANIEQPSELKAKLSKKDWSRIDQIVEETFQVHAPITCYLLKLGCKLENVAKTSMVLQMQVPEVTLNKSLQEMEFKGANDLLTYRIESLPLPITWASVCSPDSLGTAAKSVAKRIEETLVYEVLEHQATLKSRTSVEDTLTLLREKRCHGPYLAVCSLDNVEQQKKACLSIKGIADVIGSEVLTRTQLLLLQTTPDVVRIVLALPPTAVQWEDGFRVMAIAVPQLRTDFYGTFAVALLE